MARYTVPGLDVVAALERLCSHWGTEEVLGYVRDWVAHMDRQIATMEKHGNRTVRRRWMTSR